MSDNPKHKNGDKKFSASQIDSYNHKEINQILEAMRELKYIGSRDLSEKTISHLNELLSKINSGQKLESNEFINNNFKDLKLELENQL